MARVVENDGLIELNGRDGLDPSLVNDDIYPTYIADRTWNTWDIASLWVGMAVCIPTYMLASQMIIGGLSWLEALTMIVLGNLIVAVPMVFNGHAGTKYGIPFPVLGRASFGYFGVHLPSLLRALVACGWFGIQSWLGGLAIVSIVAVFIGTESLIDNWYAQFAGFLTFWSVNMLVVWRGTESIRFLETLAAPLLVVIGIGMLGWGVSNAGGLSTILSASHDFKRPTVELVQQDGAVTAYFNLVRNDYSSETLTIGRARASQFRYVSHGQATPSGAVDAISTVPWQTFDAAVVPLAGTFELGDHVSFQFARDRDQSSIVMARVTRERTADAPTTLRTYLYWLTAMVAFWATLALNIPDITRYARSQRDQVVGQFIGLPTTMALYSFIGVAVTCAAIISFPDILVTEDAPWDPIRLIARLDEQPVLLVGAQCAILLATLSTNIAANVISPANSFANLWPQHISFQRGGILTGLIGIGLMPWKLLEAIIGFLLTYGAILGPVVGILLADYFVVRGRHLWLDELYRTDGRYSFRRGVNPVAMIALALGILIVLCGLWIESLEIVYETGWFSGFMISFCVYSALMTFTRKVPG